jgi:hypothetical protein
MRMALNWNFINVLMLGAAFFLLFTAFQTTGIIQVLYIFIHVSFCTKKVLKLNKPVLWL